jgi:hypothetical protein
VRRPKAPWSFLLHMISRERCYVTGSVRVEHIGEKSSCAKVWD